ncbi:acyltransferase family protein [Lactiplantibacillus pentosus]|uniref:acyltransferase family protein n=1 Tax=Lactiplantibacillus pentosus TaxID=1589 RepID=UPI0022E7E099|nr:acyltransferase family protein [Lactiplantibacillus pentosus]
MAKRIEWIDIAKGIAILAVVVGHTLGPYNGQLFGSLIFAFHMPIFFMLSGYLSSTPAHSRVSAWGGQFVVTVRRDGGVSPRRECRGALVAA